MGTLLGLGTATKHPRGAATAIGTLFGSLVGLILFSFGYWSGQDLELVTLAWLGLSALGAFSGIVSVTIGGDLMMVAEGGRREMSVRFLRVVLLTVGVICSIIGVAISFFCSPSGCATKPFRSSGILLLAFGIPLFLGGMVLLASTVGEPLEASE